MLDRDYMPDTLNKDPTRGDSVINLTVEEVLAGFSTQGPTEFDGYLDPNSATNPRRSEPEKSSNYTYSISP